MPRCEIKIVANLATLFEFLQTECTENASDWNGRDRMEEYNDKDELRTHKLISTIVYLNFSFIYSNCYVNTCIFIEKTV